MKTASITKRYQWDDGNVISRIDVREQRDGRAVAYIYANPNEEFRQQRQDIRAALRLKGWGTLSDHREEQFALRVSGLSNGQELLTMLQQQGFVNGPPQTSAQKSEETQQSGGGILKNDSLRASAIAYTIGDGLYYMGGVKDHLPERGRQRKNMALSFAVGDAALGFFGGGDDARQFRSLLGKLKKHMDASGIEIPKNAAIHVEVARLPQSFLTTARDFLSTHINSIKMLAEVVGGFFAFRGGVKGKSALDMAGGIVVMSGWAGALLVPEKKRDPEKLADAGMVEKAISYIQEKPTRLAGWAGLLFNSMTVGGSLKTRDTTRSKFDLAAVTTMFGANTLYAMSNKTVGGDIKTNEMVSDVYSVAAQILNKQPDGVRENAIESTAKFLGQRTEIKDTHQQIIVRLKEEMAIQRQNPWFEKVGLAPYTPAPKKGHHKAEDMVITNTVPPVEDVRPQLTVQKQDAQHKGGQPVAANDPHVTVAQSAGAGR